MVTTADAQTMTDTVTVKAVQSGYNFGYDSGQFGTVSPTTTADGHSYSAIYQYFKSISSCCVAKDEYFSVSGFGANPGQSWLTSVATTAVTLTGASATNFSYANGIATWSWTQKSLNFAIGSNTVTVVHSGAPGYLDLKFQVLGVDYAPPGSKSSVNYGDSAMRGTATTDSNSFKSTTSVSTSGDIGVNLFGAANGGLTETTTTSYSQQTGNTNTVTIATTASNTDIVYGPTSSALGVDHDYDVIWVWLNPIAIVYAQPNTVTFGGYAWNASDDAGEMEVQPLYVTWLKNPSTIPANVAARLSRQWDGTKLGGLTAADYAAILATDPFVSASYNPTSDTNHRFDLVGGSTIPYDPPPAGGNPITTTGTILTQMTTSAGKSSQTTYSLEVALDFTSQLTLIADIAQSLKVSNTWETTDSWSSTINSQVGKTASYSITGPATTDKYTGPVTFQVWRDNIYGSFMFYPVQ